MAARMTKGKYAGATFTPDQKKARRWWERAQKDQCALLDALCTTDATLTREEYHARLDKVFDSIERRRAKALDLFPEVDQSFTIATLRVKL